MTKKPTPPPSDPADVVDATPAQQTLPTMELPEYHGRKPVGMKTALSGAGTRVSRPHSISDRVVLVIEARVKKAGHEDTDDGLVYTETLKVLDLFELSSAQGSRLISTVRSLYRTGEDAAKGKVPIPALGDVGYTDESGVVLTPAEVAEMRGDPVHAILAPSMTPVVVVFSDGMRSLWPDEFGKDVVRPHVGQVMDDPDGGTTVTVAELLDHQTGEPYVDEPAPELAPAGIPDLPPPPAAGDDGWDDPDPATVARMEAELPTSADFAFLDCALGKLKEKLGEVDDVVVARRLVNAEKQGRGKALVPRPGAIKVLTAKVAELEGAQP